jgi:hypothetical protein
MTAVGDKILGEDLRTEDGLARYRTMVEWANANQKLIVKDGKNFTITDPPEPTSEELAKRARERRDILLAETDYLLMPDYPVSEETLEEVKAYRQALRDLPEQAGFPQNISFPEKPKEI